MTFFLPTLNKGRPFLIPAQMMGEHVINGRRRRLGGGDQLHIGFLQRSPALHMVALRAGGHHIFPGLCATQVARDDVIDRQIGFLFSAVLAGEMISAEEFAAG